jgi:hypothetical protein
MVGIASERAAARMSEQGRRDAIGTVFQVLHMTILVYILIGWALPGVTFYIVFVPVMVLHWPLNRNTCVINNFESLIRTGRWRNPDNVEEGAWLRILIKSVTGLDFTVRQTDLMSYGLLALLWGLGVWHRFGW